MSDIAPWDEKSYCDALDSVADLADQALRELSRMRHALNAAELAAAWAR